MGDRKIVIVLSGEICTGKTTLADKLEERFDFKRCKTREGLAYFAEKELKGAKPDRAFLQSYGEKLDNEGGGKWVLDYFGHVYGKDFDKSSCYLIDSVRILQQIQHIRDAYSFFVFHIHLKAAPETLEKRFSERGEITILPREEQKAKYEKYKSDKTEQQVRNLEREADLVIDTDRCNAEDVLVRVTSYFTIVAADAQ